jgi:hypothetical protein
MFYIDLPWYALIIWAVFALIVLLPWIAIPVIGIGALLHGAFGYKRSAAKSPAGFQLHPGQLGLTMADGGEKIEKDTQKGDTDNT